jgi:hypothetical protein
LLAIGFSAGDVLPFGDHVILPDITPMALANKSLLGHTSKLVVTLDAKIQDDEVSWMAKLEKDKEQEAIRIEKLVSKVEKEQLEKVQAQEKAALEQRKKLDDIYQQRLALMYVILVLAT